MGLVNQESALFATSIRENIMYGKAGNVSMDDIINATTVSYAHDFINLLPDRYETQVAIEEKLHDCRNMLFIKFLYTYILDLAMCFKSLCVCSPQCR